MRTTKTISLSIHQGAHRSVHAVAALFLDGAGSARWAHGHDRLDIRTSCLESLAIFWRRLVSRAACGP